MHFSDPKGNVLQIGLKEGMKVADLGAGAGHSTICAAHVVGESGHVYAVDIQEDLLKRVREAAADSGLKNVSTIWGDFEKLGGTTLKDQALDAVILSNTLFQLEHREGALAEIKRILKPGGRFLVVDWAGSYSGMGPAPEHVVPEHAAEELFISGGFHKTKAFRAGPHHYSILFTAP
ncbi:MAG: class I SAM-dependent methyltransferase [Patescibacteria group bacterium]